MCFLILIMKKGKHLFKLFSIAGSSSVRAVEFLGNRLNNLFQIYFGEIYIFRRKLALASRLRSHNKKNFFNNIVFEKYLKSVVLLSRIQQKYFFFEFNVKR